MIPYKGYLIWGKAVGVHPNVPQWWHSHGDVSTNAGKASSNINTSKAEFSSPKKLRKGTALNSAKSGWTKT
jgi:hypothetical protein